ncbi:MAG: tetratricopeptide repeat protein, partial [Candidatus Binatia bacterium]
SAKAVAEFARIPKTSEYFVDSRIHSAYVHQRDEKTDEAIEEIRQALEVKPDSTELLGFLASLYREKKDYENAVSLLEKTIELEPENDKYWFTLGAVYDEAKRKEDCIVAMQKAIAIEPKNAAALNYLGYTWAEMGVELDEAERLIRRALDLEPDDGFYIDSLAWVYYQRGDFDKAAQTLERAVELVDDDPTVTEHLGDAYQKLGRHGDAARVYRDALAKTKEAEQVERLKGKISSVESRATGLGSRL